MVRMKRRERPRLPHEEFAARARFAKPQYRESFGAQMDTSQLTHRKIHPTRDEAYKKWLFYRPCAIRDKTDPRTDQRHVCWHPAQQYYHNFFIPSDPAHTGKAYSGRLKQSDSGCFALCRLAHNLQEANMDDFDLRFDIDRFALAAELYARFKKERE